MGSYFRLRLSILVVLLSGLFTLQLKETLGSQASAELDRILQAAHVELPSITEGDVVHDQARSLIAEAGKARYAIAAYVSNSPIPKEAGTASSWARELQAELMDRIGSQFSGHLDKMKKVEDEKLYRGIGDGVLKTKSVLFAEQVLQPNKKPIERVAEDADYRERLRVLRMRIKAALGNFDPIAALRRWKIKRLLGKMSVETVHSSTPRSSFGGSVGSRDLSPKNIDELGARLAAIVALKKTQKETAAEEAKDVEAAQLLEKAPVIHSDVMLRNEIKAAPKTLTRMMMSKNWPGADLMRALPKWGHAIIKGPLRYGSKGEIRGMTLDQRRA
ncbi:uncharacterized protein MEPE_05640 [Melanopsichium pennsylvanicum]|uniref:Uncharacterized protein n=2 Tax=Melanopsichium pennsylvanicum TaxID=63383 RepID=A0AAJ4XS81_9BASI|nr:hypothetical protein BN887_00630 [Melanopsichium pennsylvanicum 4]SNX86931.1 uncharacterized protein MEPE_05640 [Melanopsichium pennsylvanicum]